LEGREGGGVRGDVRVEGFLIDISGALELTQADVVVCELAPGEGGREGGRVEGRERGGRADGSGGGEQQQEEESKGGRRRKEGRT